MPKSRSRRDSERSVDAMALMSQGDRAEALSRGSTFASFYGKTINEYASSPSGTRAVKSIAGIPGAFTTEPGGSIQISFENKNMGPSSFSSTTKRIERAKEKKK